MRRLTTHGRDARAPTAPFFWEGGRPGRILP